MICTEISKIKYLDDFYLAGSAGHRIEYAWSIIHRELRPNAINVLKRYPTGGYLLEDLWAETILKLMDDDHQYPKLADGRCHAEITRFSGQIKLLNYCIIIARRLAIQAHRKRKPQTIDDDFLKAFASPVDSQKQAQLQEKMEHLKTVMEEGIRSLPDEQKFLIVMVYREGMKKKDAAKMIGIPDYTATRRIQSAIKKLRSMVADLSLD